jgi:HSP20 family protein
MDTQDNRSGQQGGSAPQQGAGQQGAGMQPGGQAQQFNPGGAQQGGGATGQQGSQQESYSPGREQQGGQLSRRGGGMPSLFSGRSSPFEMFRRLDEDMDRLFQQFWGGGRNLMRGRGADVQHSMWMPQVEVCEEGGKLHVYSDLPGLRKEDVKLSIEGDQLIVQGERRSGREEGKQGSGFYHSERSYGSFYRSIPLPEGVDPQTVEASFKDGVLDVCFDAPRMAQQQSRQIEIREAGQQGAGSSTAGKR